MDETKDGADDRDASLPARMLNEYVYCPRLFHFMHVRKIFVHSADTIEGVGQHGRAKKGSRGAGLVEGLPWGGEARELVLTTRDGRLTGKVDVIARSEDGSLVPVEAKRGAAPVDEKPFEAFGIELPGNVWPNDLVQLGVQGRLLRDAGERCVEGRVYYRKNHVTARVVLDERIDEFVERVLVEALGAMNGPLPPPLIESPKCLGCSLASICLPDETNVLLARQNEPPRPVIAARSDGGGLYVMSPGAKIGKTSEALTVTMRDGEHHEVPLKDCEHIAVFGPVQVTTQAMTLMMGAGRSVFFHSTSGRLVGRATPAGMHNLALRRRQFRVADEPGLCLDIGRSVLQAKIRNQRVLVRRNAGDVDEQSESLRALEREALGAEKAESLNEAMGHEGLAARLYFDLFSAVLGDDERGPLMSGRTRRPPKDPVNAALSFGYSLLLSDASAALIRAGLDPDLGFLHQPVPGRPALALDLMEPFRPLIVDSVVLRAFRTGQLARADFVEVGPSWRLHDAPRRVLVGAYERRMDELVTHPMFGYRMSYRRIMEVEARLLGRYIEGELPKWEPIVTR